MLVQRKPPASPQTPDNAQRLYLSRGYFAIVDRGDYETLRRYYWRAVRSEYCWYAIRREKVNEKTIHIRMHRQIMECPNGYVVHHLNHNTLDNRKCNLIVVTDEEHKLYHTFFVESEPF